MVKVCHAHTAREGVALSMHREEQRRLPERHTPEAEEEGGMWNEAQARNRIEENPGGVMLYPGRYMV